MAKRRRISCKSTQARAICARTAGAKSPFCASSISSFCRSSACCFAVLSLGCGPLGGSLVGGYFGLGRLSVILPAITTSAPFLQFPVVSGVSSALPIVRLVALLASGNVLRRWNVSLGGQSTAMRSRPLYAHSITGSHWTLAQVGSDRPAMAPRIRAACCIASAGRCPGSLQPQVDCPPAGLWPGCNPFPPRPGSALP